LFQVAVKFYNSSKPTAVM